MIGKERGKGKGKGMMKIGMVKSEKNGKREAVIMKMERGKEMEKKEWET